MTRNLLIYLVQFFVLFSTLTFTTSSFADNDGTWTYSLREANTEPTASVEGCVEVCPTDLVIPDTINGYTVTHIGNSSFSGNNLTSVTIPDSVTSIGYLAFDSNELTSIIIGNSVIDIQTLAFSNNQLTNVTIPDNVTTMGWYAFQNNQISNLSIGNGITVIDDNVFSNNQLTSLTIGNNVTRIGDSAFKANLLGNLIISDSVTDIDSSAFSGNLLTNVTIGNSVINIGSGAFSGNQLTSVTIPDSVTTIGGSAFSSNELTSVVIGDGVITIGNYAFNRNKLTSVIIPANVTSIGIYAFNLNDLTDIIIGENVTSIGISTFRDNKLTDVTIPDNVTTIGSYAFFGNQLSSLIIGNKVTNIESDAFKSNNLTDLIIPDSVTTIGSSAFKYNKLTNLSIGNSVTTIAPYTFQGNKLTNLIIPDSVTTVGAGAFSYNQLASVMIGNSVSTIDSGAFQGNELANLIIPDSVTTIGSSAFNQNKLTSIRIPNGITSIERSAFSYNELTHVVIPDSVITLESGAFSDNQLASVTIPVSVTSIEQLAFLDNELTDVLFLGDRPSIQSDTFDANDLSTITYCSDTIGWPGQSIENVGPIHTNDCDGDGVLDVSDFYPLISLGISSDTDSDGIPDECDVDCLVLGMVADLDDDNDGILDNDDLAPLDNTQGDTIDPIFTSSIVPLTIEATGSLTNISTYFPVATDNSGIAPIITSNQATKLPLGEYQFIWTATDNQGNASTHDQTISIVDTTPPELEDSIVITLDATGKLTDVSSILDILAFDLVDGEITTLHSGTNMLKSGFHQIEITASDNSGNETNSSLELSIRPLTRLGIDTFAEPESIAYIPLRLSGEAAHYPVSVDYNLAGILDKTSTFSIDEGVILNIPVDIPTSSIDGDTIQLTLANIDNALLGEKTLATVHVQKSNFVPIVDILLEQKGKRVTTVDTSAGDVTVYAVIKDINRQDTHSIEWAEPELEVLTGQSIQLDVTNLSTGSHELMATVTESNTDEAYSTQNTLSFIVSSELNGLDNSDSDGDGIVDYKDTNNNVTQLPFGQETIQVETGITLSVGSITQLLSQGLSDGAEIDEQLLGDTFGVELAQNSGFTSLNPIVNFKASGLATTGDRVSIILPMTDGMTLPANAVYRKFSTSTGWFSFISDTENHIASAQKINGECPLPDNNNYKDGLNKGDNCVELTLVDGGIYDADGKANGSIEDTGVLAVINQAPVISITATDSLQEGDQVTIDATASIDPEGSTLTYNWQLIEGPMSIIEGATSPKLTLQAKDIENDSIALIELFVSDGSSIVTEQYSLNITSIPESKKSSGGSMYTLLLLIFLLPYKKSFNIFSKKY
jgi:hypothetical protein